MSETEFPSLSRREATRILQKATETGEDLGELMPHLYSELRALAGSLFRDQPRHHTLQPTALVHEVYLRLIDHESAGWNGRAHFMAVASKAMRQILVDHYRRRHWVCI